MNIYSQTREALSRSDVCPIALTEAEHNPESHPFAAIAVEKKAFVATLLQQWLHQDPQKRNPFTNLKLSAEDIARVTYYSKVCFFFFCAEPNKKKCRYFFFIFCLDGREISVVDPRYAGSCSPLVLYKKARTTRLFNRRGPN